MTMIKSVLSNDILEIVSGLRQVSENLYQKTESQSWEDTVTKVGLTALGIQIGILVMSIVFPVGYLQAVFIIYHLHAAASSIYHVFRSHLLFENESFISDQDSSLIYFSDSEVNLASYDLIAESDVSHRYLKAEYQRIKYDMVVHKMHETNQEANIISILFAKSMHEGKVSWFVELYSNKEETTSAVDRLSRLLGITDTEKVCEITPLNMQAAIGFLSQSFSPYSEKIT